MSYLLYSLTFIVLVCGTVLYLTRSRWIPLIPVPDYVYDRLPSSFAGDIEAGFTSSDFDLTANVAEGDSRAGLDQNGKREIRKIMRSRGVNFDEARRLYTEQRFAKNNIGPDGRPRDPKRFFIRTVASEWEFAILRKFQLVMLVEVLYGY